MAGAAGRDPPERLDVDVQQLARVAALVTIGRLRWLQPTERLSVLLCVRPGRLVVGG
jgi:hypothetical protein